MPYSAGVPGGDPTPPGEAPPFQREALLSQREALLAARDLRAAPLLSQSTCPTCGVSSQAGNCPTCGATAASAPFTSYVYAIGRIEARFPRVSIEKEYAQAVGRAETHGLSDREASHRVLSRPENRYIVRQLCWVFSVEGLETYLLEPRDPADLSLLIEALRPVPRPTDVDVVVGVKGPVAPATHCNGLMIPIVAFDQIYSFDVDTLIGSIPRPEKVDPERFKPTSEEVFHRITQIADNTGDSDGDRALNYLAVRYPPIYARAADRFLQDFSLTGVEVRPSPLSGVRKIVEVIFFFTNRKTDFSEAFFVRVDVTEEFPFVVTKLTPYLSL
jgi:hypothetical protein